VTVYGRYAQRMLEQSDGVRLDAAEPVVLGALQARLDELLAHVKPVRMLDAGCGQNRAVPVASDRYVVGIDISENQVVNNNALDEAIVGDIETSDLGHSCFDAVICWYVLEHIKHPENALLNFKRSLKPHGVLIVAVPHALSIRGLVTRFTPYWFHGWVRRLMDNTASRPEPFPTVMSSSITPKQLCAFARDHGLAIEFLSEFEGWEQKKLRARLRLTGRAFQAIQALVKALSLGTITVGVTDVIVVMQNRG